MVDAVDEAHPDLGMVIRHQDDVKQLVAVGVEPPQPCVHIHQSLQCVCVCVFRTELTQGVKSKPDWWVLEQLLTGGCFRLFSPKLQHIHMQAGTLTCVR